jgi:hypothetical protein
LLRSVELWIIAMLIQKTTIIAAADAQMIMKEMPSFLGIFIDSNIVFASTSGPEPRNFASFLQVLRQQLPGGSLIGMHDPPRVRKI